jgi:hypothetical protein
MRNTAKNLKESHRIHEYSPVEPPVDPGEEYVEEELNSVDGEPGHQEGHAEEHVDGRQLAQAHHSFR